MYETLGLYLGVFFFSLFFFNQAVICKKKRITGSKENYIIAITISFLPLFLLIALRDHVGADYTEYANTFQSVARNYLEGANIQYRGIGFTYFEKFIALFVGDNYYWFYAVCAFLSIWSLFYALLNGSKSPTLSLYIYFCFCLYLGLLNQFRQGLAMTLVMVAMCFLFQNKKKNFIVFVLMAAIIHPSALICLVLLFLHKVPISKKMLTGYAVVCGVVLLGFPIIEKILSYTSYGQTYLYWDLYNQSALSSTLFNLGVRLVFVIAALLVKDKVLKENSNAIVLYHMALINLVLQCGAVKLYILARLSTYFYLSYIFLFPLILPHIAKKVGIKYKSTFKPIVLFAFMLYFMVYYFSSSGASGGGYEIYRSILFKRG